MTSTDVLHAPSEWRWFHCDDLVELSLLPSLTCCSSCHEDAEMGYNIGERELPCGCVLEYCCFQGDQVAKLFEGDTRQLAMRLHGLAQVAI